MASRLGSLVHDAVLLRLLSSSLTASLAGGVFLGALPIAVAARGGGPLQVGLTAAALTAWWVVSIPLALIVDRLGVGPALRMLAPLRIVALIILAGHALVDGTASITVLVAGALLYGFVDVLGDTATSTLPALVVDEERYDDAYSALSAVVRVTDLIVGPTAGALLIAVAPWLPFTVAACALLVSYVTLTPFFGDPRTRAFGRDASTQRRPWWRETVRGLTHVFGDRFIRGIAIALVGIVAAEELVTVTVAPWFRDGSGIENWPQALGLLRGTAGVAAVCAALLAAPVARTLGRYRTLCLVGPAGACSAGILAAGARWQIVLCALLVSAVAEAMWVPLVQGEVARRTPRELMGRTRAAMMFLTWGTLPVTAAVGGGLASQSGIRPVLLAGCAAALACCAGGLTLMRAQRPVKEQSLA
jgi:hypothetical protein